MTTRRTTNLDSEKLQGLDLQEQIRQRAYQLYEERGREDGFAEEDWYKAEAEMAGKSFKAAA